MSASSRLSLPALAGGRVCLAALAAMVVVALGYLAGDRPTDALAAAVVVFGVGVLAVDMTAIPILAFPAMLILNRVGGTLSVSDLILFVAALCALTQLRLVESPELRSLIWVVVGYQTALIPTLFWHRYRASYIEWVHELFLVGGSLVVGWVAGRTGRARLAVNLFVIPVAGLAVWACILAPVRHFDPVYLLNFQKNALGDLCAIAGIVAYTRPAWLGWRTWAGNAVVVICGLGVLATQSRQAMVSLAAGIAIVAVRGHVERRRSRIVLLAMVPLVVVAYITAHNQLSSSNKFNSAHQRLTWYTDSINVWHTSRWLGVGLRWWYSGQFTANFQPPNAELEMLTSAGVVGLAAFLIAAIVELRLLWRVDPRFGTIAFAVVFARLVQGQLDLFWVASQSALPWLIVGVALGALSRERIRGRDAPPVTPSSVPASLRSARPGRPAGSRPRATLATSGPSGR